MLLKSFVKQSMTAKPAELIISVTILHLSKYEALTRCTCQNCITVFCVINTVEIFVFAGCGLQGISSLQIQLA